MRCRWKVGGPFIAVETAIPRDEMLQTRGRIGSRAGYHDPVAYGSLKDTPPMQRRWPAAAFLLALAAALLLPERGLRAAPVRRTPAPMPVAAPLRNAFILSFRSPDLVTNEPD